MLEIHENSIVDFSFQTYIALGSFDGLHHGHMSLINKVIELSQKFNCKSMVYTFKNHPLSVVNKSLAPKLIMDNDTKKKILDESGVDILCLVEFNKKFMEMSPEEFIVNIKTKYNMKGVITGFNYKFGHKNSGDIELLKKLGVKYNFEVYIIDAQKHDSQVISSSRIRKLIENGDIINANKLLTKPFSISGYVNSGRKIGRELGFPTANIFLSEDMIYPKIGVYYTNVEVNGEIYRGITNIGFNPTVSGSYLSFETHILEFCDDIYDKNITIYFVERIRDEKKFNSKHELVKQLSEDKLYASNKELITKF